MKQKVKEKVQQKDSHQLKNFHPECHHFWVIEVANGPTSIGTCKACGDEKVFYNAFPSFNPLRKNANPFNLPRMEKVKVEKESNS